MFTLSNRWMLLAALLIVVLILLFRPSPTPPPAATATTPMQPGPPAATLRQALSPQELAGIDAWLHCDDCTDGELAYVRDSVGTTALPLLREYVRRPNTDRTDRLRANIYAEYRRLPSPSTDSATFVDLYLQNYQATVRRRAAMAMGELGDTDGLRAVMDEAGFVGYRSDVRAVIEEAYVAAGGTLPSAQGPDRVVLRPSALTLAVADSATLEAILMDADGNLMERPLTWTSDQPGHATVTPTPAVGYARVVGIDEGATRIIVDAGTVADTTNVTVTGAPSPTAGLHIVSGDAQTDTVGTALGTPLVVALTDAGGNPVAGASVTWQVSRGSATPTNAMSMTDALGRAALPNVQLGPAPGWIWIDASSGAHQVRFRIRAIEPRAFR